MKRDRDSILEVNQANMNPVETLTHKLMKQREIENKLLTQLKSKRKIAEDVFEPTKWEEEPQFSLRYDSNLKNKIIEKGSEQAVQNGSHFKNLKVHTNKINTIDVIDIDENLLSGDLWASESKPVNVLNSTIPQK